ncbi:MAG: histidine kinase [Bdellovibrio sp. CG10_big_fil_rev_8_21_14_0_10_47_8]|nr:MAG: histidine kinase [Bdellovibrio sp. CG10_big_fil_rev_8_21_14_0_10_47_8]
MRIDIHDILTESRVSGIFNVEDLVGGAAEMNSMEDKVDLKPISFPGKIHLINNDRELALVTQDLISVKELGFDTETKPSFKKGEVHKVALLQMSTDQDAFLLRLHSITQFDSVVEVFENPEVLKVGLAIRDDLKQLQKVFKFSPKNFVELQDIAKAQGLKNFGLKGMAEEVLNARLSKGPKLTNWEARSLSDQQLMYAATDAWIGLHLFRRLRGLG